MTQAATAPQTDNVTQAATAPQTNNAQSSDSAPETTAPQVQAPSAAGKPVADDRFGAAAQQLRQQWLETQAYLLDDPRDSVARADALIEDALKHLESVLADVRAQINDYWSADNKLTTDELRTTMQEYRRLFRHVLTAGDDVPRQQLAKGIQEPPSDGTAAQSAPPAPNPPE